jgi:hypothetical protein
VKWLTNREWLDYDESNDIMTCKIWQRMKDDDDDFCKIEMGFFANSS